MPERAGTIALTLPSGNGKYTYWLEYRDNIDYGEKQGTVLFNLSGYLKGGLSHDTRYWDTISLFLDMTPNSGGFRKDTWWDEDFTDGGLAPGQSFTDPWGGFKVTTLGIGGPPHSKYSWAEVKVESVGSRGIGAQGPAGIMPKGNGEMLFPGAALPDSRYNLLGQSRDFRTRPPPPVLRIDKEGNLSSTGHGPGR